MTERRAEQGALEGLRRAIAQGGDGQRLPLQRVRKAYEQIADQLRRLIVTGALRQGERLPTETSLAEELGVSRATVREALRILAAEGLVVVTRGPSGGAYVTRPSLDYASKLLQTNVALLTELDAITLEELLEARALIEVPAARLAARRSGRDELERLEGAIPDDAGPRSAEARFTSNAGFHTSLMAASGNALLEVAALPIFTVLQTSLARSSLGAAFDRRIDADHRRITDAIARADEDDAEAAMHAHLTYLRPHYRRVWRRARETAPHA